MTTLVLFSNPNDGLFRAFYKHAQTMFDDVDLVFLDANLGFAKEENPESMTVLEVLGRIDEEIAACKESLSSASVGYDIRIKSLEENKKRYESIYECLGECLLGATVSQLDGYLLEYRDSFTLNSVISNASFRVRNRAIAEKLLESRQEDTIQIAFLDYRHYEVMYELFDAEGYEFIEKNFCFFYLYTEEDLDFLKYIQEQERAGQSLFLFKTPALPMDTISSEGFFAQVSDSLAGLSALSFRPSFLGEKTEACTKQLKQLIQRIEEKRTSAEDMIKRAGIIGSLVKEEIGENQSYAALDFNVAAGCIVNHIWKDIDVKNLDESLLQDLGIHLTGLPEEKAPIYLDLIQGLLPKILEKLKEEGLYDSIIQGEFTTESSLEMLKIKIPGLAPSAKSVAKNSSSCWGSFFTAVGVVAAAVAVTAAVIYQP